MKIYRFAILAFFIVASCRQEKPVVEATSGFDNPNLYEPVEIDYSIKGTGDTTLLFIHGLNLDQTYWKDQVEEFSPSYKTVTVDLAGHGKSGKEREHWTIRSFAKDVIRVIDREKLSNVILIGHSMGGDIALEIADSIPSSVIGIIGIDNFKDVGFDMTDEFEKGFLEHIENFRKDYKKGATEMVKAMLDSTTDEVVASRITASYLQADPDITLAIFKNLFPAMESAPDKLSRLNFPLRLIINDHPPRNYEAWNKVLPKGYHLSIMEDTGHFPMVERPEEFNKYLWIAVKGKGEISSVGDQSTPKNEN
jgi:sigma-B regulation protein RsbQ